jgi:HEAT repeat protein
MPQVQRLLRDDYVPVRFASALAVGDMVYRPAKDIIERLMLQDPDGNVRIAVAYAMGKLGRPESFEIVRQAVSSKDPTLRANAVVLLGKSGDKSSLGLLSWALSDKDSDDKVRFQAVDAMARLGDEKIFHKLWAIVLSSYADDRIVGIRAMGALGTEKAKEVLITKLDDEILEVRLAAAEQLGMLRDKTGEYEVAKVFERNLTAGMDDEERERTNVLAAMAIGQIGTARVTKFLPQLLSDNSRFVRIAAARAVLQLSIKGGGL